MRVLVFAMRTNTMPLKALLAFCGLVACERRSVPSVSDAATTGAPIVTSEPATGDAAVTSASLPIRESEPIRPEPIEATPDAGATETTTSDAGPRPAWVPKDASLTIVQSGDLERNLGIVKVPPAPTPARLTVDAGGVAVDIEIHPR